MTGDVPIRAERVEDRDAIDAVVAAAFGHPDEAALVDALRSTDAFVPDLSLVAGEDREIVGHVLFTLVRVRGHDGPLAALAPLAVRPDRQREGIGSALVYEGIARCDARGLPAVVVLGDPAYYGRFGFGPAAGLGLTPPEGWPEVAYQALALAAHDPSCRGEVMYPAAFAGLG